MKNILLIATLLLTTLIFSCDKEKEAIVDTQDNELQDVNSLATFETEVNEGVSLVFFHASWCSICAQQRPNVEVLPNNADFSGVFFAEVEFEDNPEINDSYSVFNFPTTVIYKDGNEIERYEGAGHSEATLSAKLNELL
ncbi:MAG: thioredoxin family protein [Chitinophagales bacterium]